MPTQSSVTLTANPDGTGNLQIGSVGFPNINFFNLGFDPQYLGNSLRLAHLVGNYGQPDSAEFLNAINNILGGVKAPDADYWITSVINNPDGTVTIGTGPTKTGPEVQTFTQQIPSLSSDFQDPSVIIGFVAAFLRKGGYTSLTAAALAAVNAKKFWF